MGTIAQMVADFVGVHPYLAERAVVILHDVRMHLLQSGVCKILARFTEFRFAYYTSFYFTETSKIIGTGIMYRGFADSDFSGFHEFEIPWQFGRPQFPAVYMVPMRQPDVDDHIINLCG